MSRLREYLLVGLAAVATAAAVYSWYRPLNPVTRTEYVKVPEIQIKVKRVPMPVEKIVTLEKEVVVEKLKLPDWIRDPAQQVVATAEFAPTSSGYDAACAINTQTGEGQIIGKERRPPFFTFEDIRQIGARWGVSNSGQRGDIFARWQFARVGNAHIGGYGEGSAAERRSFESTAMIEITMELGR